MSNDGLQGATISAVHEPVMGTFLQLQITAATETDARRVQAALLDEAHWLQARFTVFDPASELCRWRSGEVDEVGPDLDRLLALSARWQQRSAGTFNPLAGVLTERWLQAVAGAEAPPADELRDLAASIADPRFGVAQGAAHRLGDCSALDLNAIAKGHVVDRMAALALASFDVERLVVNAGGDLTHHGAGSLRVGVEDPHNAYDNVAPLLHLQLVGQAVATSGVARRWFQVGGRRWSRVLDPRTGWPVDHAASATVVAPDAATADVLATVASVLEPAEAVAFIEGLAAGDGIDAACLVIDRSGGQHRSAGWAALEV